MPNPNIRVEITDAREFHCFRIVLEAAVERAGGERHPLEIMFHARQLVDLIHKASVALCEWQAETTGFILERLAAAQVLHDPVKFQEFLNRVNESGGVIVERGEIGDERLVKLAWEIERDASQG